MSDGVESRRFGKSDWDEVRLAFYNSIMIDSELSSLARNAELEEWPIQRDGETPAKYVDFTWEEIQELPDLADNPERVDHLIEILKDTLAFDDPFGDMVATVETATEEDDALEKNLSDLEISSDCPLSFGALSKDTLSFCESEGVKTVGEFAHFAESMAQNILVGGDFKELLNAIVMKDEVSIARYLPFRPAHKGLHMIESLGQISRNLNPRESASLLKRYGKRLTEEQAKLADLNPERLTQIESQLVEKAEEIFKYFEKDAQEIREKIASGTQLERCFVVINDEDAEIIGSGILKVVLERNKKQPVDDAPAENSNIRLGSKPPKRPGFFARLFGRK